VAKGWHLDPDEKIADALPSKPSRRQRRPEEVRAKIIEAALSAFARQGFSGVSLRSIARDADVTIQLLVYHFASKEALWEQTVNDTFGIFDRLHDNEALPSSASTRERLHRFIVDLVKFTADRPDLLRIMLHEAGQVTARMTWLAENRTGKMLNEFCDLVTEGQKQGIVYETPAARLFYAAAAIASLPFSVSAEYNYLVGKDPFTPSEMARTIELIERIIFK